MTTQPYDKPWSAACERNRDPILTVLQRFFGDRRRVLEIGSGTGQHAVHFAAALPWLEWQSSDRAENLAGIQHWLDDAALSNTPPPLSLDIGIDSAPATRYDAVFSANTLHIMAWTEVETLFARAGNLLVDDAVIVIYGPFNDDGHYSSASNATFDASLRRRGAHMGIRDQSAVDALARAAGFDLIEAVEMPANNRCLVWRRGAA